MAKTPRAPATAYDRVVAALAKHGTPVSPGGKAHCPAHEDAVESLSVSRGKSRAVVLYCHAGCSPLDVVAALGLPAEILSASAPEVPTGAWRTTGRYKYADPTTGKHLFTQIRKERGAEKRYQAQPAKVQERMREAGTLPLYGEAGLVDARQNGWPVYLVEGEGNADRLQAWADGKISAPDLVAVSHVNGASAWHPFYAERFTGLDVTVVVDRDRPGDAWAEDVRRDLAPVARSLRFVQSATTGEKDDIVDHLDAGHDLDALVPWEPSEETDEDLRREVEERKTRLRVDQIARAELAAEGWTAPPDLGTLTEQLALGVPPAQYVVDGLMPLGANVVMSAQYKTGKTTAALNLARSLTDGTPLFGKFAVDHDQGAVAWWNLELDQRTALRWMAEMGFTRGDRLHVEHLRGRVVPLRSPEGRRWAVQRLRAHGVRTWIVDPFGALFDGDENSNTEVREFLQVLDQIKAEGGVDNLVLVAHTGHGTSDGGAVRARGATRIMDWGDVLWAYRGGTDANPDRRWFSADGRDVSVREVALDFEPETRSLQLVAGAGSRHSEQRAALAVRAAEAVVAHHATYSRGMTKTELEAALGRGDSNAKRAAVREAIDQGWIKTEVGARRAILHWPGEDPHHLSVADFRPRKEDGR